MQHGGCTVETMRQAFKAALKVVKKVLEYVVLAAVQTSMIVAVLKNLSSEPVRKPNRGQRKTSSCMEPQRVRMS